MKIKIIYEDKDIIVCYKPAGIATQTKGFMQADVVSELKNYLAESGQGEPFVGVVQRLDQPVEGVLVFGKNPKATAGFSKQLMDQTLKKEYLAAVFLESAKDSANSPDTSKSGSIFKEKEICPASQKTVLTDYLIKNPKTNLSEVTTAGHKNAKKAELEYTVIKQEKIKEGTILYIKIDLHTGRHHQIRVQMSHAGMPLLGDQKYGTKQSQQVSAALVVKDVALCAKSVSFKHPATGKGMSFSIRPQKQILQNVTE